MAKHSQEIRIEPDKPEAEKSWGERYLDKIKSNLGKMMPSSPALIQAERGAVASMVEPGELNASQIVMDVDFGETAIFSGDFAQTKPVKGIGKRAFALGVTLMGVLTGCNQSVETAPAVDIATGLPTEAPTEAVEPSVPAILTAVPAPTEGPATSEAPTEQVIDLIADTPPEFKSGSGGEVQGISEGDLNKLIAWEVYQKVYRDEVGPDTWDPNDGSFEADMLKYLEGRTDLEIMVKQDPGTGGILVAVATKSGDVQSVYWDFDNGVVANTNPMSLRPESERGLVPLSPGLTADFRFNTKDGHWYMFGVDKAGNAVEWFATDKATINNLADHWKDVEKPITDIPAWLDEQTAKYVSELGYESYQALLDDKVYGHGYDDVSRRSGTHPEVSWTYKSVYGYVVGTNAITLTPDSEYYKYGSVAHGILVAAEGSDGLAFVPCGFDANAEYAVICTDIFEGGQGHDPDYQPRQKLLSPESLDTLVGRRLIFRIVSQASQAPEKIEAEKQKLMVEKYESGYPAGYNQQIVQRGKWVDMFWQMVADDNLAPQLAERWWREGGGAKTSEELNKNRNGLALQQFYMKQFGVNSPFILVDLLADDNATIDDVGFR